MLTIKEYVKAKTIDEAYELNQKKTNCICGGMIWLKMQRRNIQTIIDLSDLGLDKIEERENEFEIGAMATLRDIEENKALNDYTNGAIKESVRHIVGVQFRNVATVGGSIFGRFGFSDVLTMFMALDSYVKLYKGGIVPLEEFAKMPKDRDILMSIIVKKENLKCVYMSQRNTKTDFPVIACGLSLAGDTYKIVLGARPAKAAAIEYKKDESMDIKEFAEKMGEFAAENFDFNTNMRASAEYRKHLAKVIVKRACLKMEGVN